jgi:hypothetical protein
LHGCDELLGLLERQREDDIVGDKGLIAGAEEPAAVGLLGQLLRRWSAGRRWPPFGADEVGAGGVELAERDGGDAEAAAGGVLEEELVEDLAGVLQEHGRRCR